jgi:quercetin dioxygenase-like cupin family protein
MTGSANMARRYFLTVAGGLAATALAQRSFANTTQPDGESALEINRAGTQASTKGADEYFTGIVRIDPLQQAQAPARVSAASVTFEPGARTAWHTHPLGQTLIIVSGLGWVQREGGPVEEVRPGDVVWFPSGLRHWHGASPTVAMTHYAIQESLDGKAVTWMEKVSDAQYRRP